MATPRIGTRHDCIMSGSINSAEAYINFQLASLSERNDHHEFEKIATRVARRRLSANILVANGPVSAGGDQKRDAESYTTYIPDELPHSAGFAAAASRSPVVVACTVQKTSLKAKFLADIDGICAIDAAPTEFIAIFSATSVPEAVTHEVQRVAREKHGVKVEVFSGMKLATVIAEPDLIWVAQRHLDLPADLLPEPDTESSPEWYTKLLRDLRDNGGPAGITPAAQGEVAAGLRHATWDADANADLTEWIDFMAAFLTNEDDQELVFHACYEIAIARFRGTGIAAGAEDLVRKALIMARSSHHANLLDDAAVLLSYWGTMWMTGAGRADLSEIQGAHDELVAQIRGELDATDETRYPVRTASLAGTLAWLHLLPNWSEMEVAHGKPTPVDAAPSAGVIPDIDVIDETVGPDDLLDVSSAMTYLAKVAELLPRARGYSVSRISDIVNLFAPVLTSQPGYESIRDAFDDAVAQVEGDAKAGERSHSRAVAFYKSGRLLEALNELHRAKARTLRGDLASNAVNVLRFIARLYQELDLDHAAKMYAFHAAMFANISDDEDVKAEVPAALFEAATATHFTGAWMESAAITRVAVLAHNALAPGGFDFERYPSLASQMSIDLHQLVAVRKYWPHLEPILEAAHTGDLHTFLSEQAREQSATIEEDEDSFQSESSGAFSGPVLTDLGPERRTDFYALGVRWVFTFANTHAAVLAAEGFVAAFQTLLADVARYAPVLVPCTVSTAIEVRSTTRGRVALTTTTDPYAVKVTLSEGVTDINSFVRKLIGAAVGLLAVPHVRPDTDLSEIFESMMKDGLGHKVFCVRPYQESADVLKPGQFAQWAAAAQPASSADFSPIESTHLPASTAVGPGYDHDLFLEATRTTYANATNWRYSTATLLRDPDVRTRIIELRADGWLDWQILGALINVALDQRIRRAGIDLETFDPDQNMTMLKRPETSSDEPIRTPIALEFLDRQMYMQAVAVGMRWGIRPLPERLHDEQLRKLLVRRYQFEEMDVLHLDLLSALDADGNLLPLVPPR